jgi:hypothetical protein
MRRDVLALLGAALCLGVFCIGFIRVDDATWLAWRAAWILGGGATMGVGLGLMIVAAASQSRSNSNAA